MLRRLGSNAARHHRWFIGAWVVLLVGLAVAQSRISHETENKFTIPGTESQDALDLLQTDFPQFANASANVVFQATSGTLEDSANQSAVSQSITDLGKIDGVANVINPLVEPYSVAFLSDDKTIALSTVTFDTELGDVSADAFDEMQAATQPATSAGINVEYGGEVVDLEDPLPPGISEYADEIGLALAALILLVAFGSVVAMGLPLGTALGALGASAAALAILQHFFTIGTINPIFGTMLGLGVGIDYSLLILNRYLQNRAEGQEVATATGVAISTGGRAVAFAGLTISIAVVALLVFGVPYLTVLGLTSAMYVAVTVVASLTLLPALIGWAGSKVESVRLPFIRKLSEVDPVDPTSFWGRWARLNARGRWLLAPLGILVLALVAVPFRSADLGFVDDGSDPTSSTQRQAYDLVADGFGAGRNGPLVVVAALPGSSSSDEEADKATVAKLAGDLDKADGVSTVFPPDTNDAGTASVIEVIPDDGPSSEQTKELVGNLRDTVIPQSLSGESLSPDDVDVGGETAELVDLSDRISERLVLFVAVVLGLAFVLLMVVFRSLLVPLKAVLLNLLMFLAAYGLMVAVFQWGWAKDLVGISETVPIESFVPVVVFAVLFGLSTDYEVFLISRVREEYDRTQDPHRAVVTGLTGTARVIASAVLIMAAVFLSFVTNPSVLVKMIGLPLGVGILIDAFVLRLTVVPALLHLMGRAAWYLPRWLDRLLPRVSIDAPSTQSSTTTT